MLITVAADIAFTLFILVCKLFLNNYTDIHYISLGFLCRAAYYWLILRKFKKDRGRFPVLTVEDTEPSPVFHPPSSI